jgi:hypothetical protein
MMPGTILSDGLLNRLFDLIESKEVFELPNADSTNPPSIPISPSLR